MSVNIAGNEADVCVTLILLHDFLAVNMQAVINNK
jgi:hypothetical protein